MQVFGLPGHLIRNGRAASRLLVAKTPDIEAAGRRDAVARWRRAMADGLTVEQAARAIGVARATLYRWEKAPQPGSRRPNRPRKPEWTHELACAVEAARADNPMWGKRKIAVLMRREGFATSASTVGRILASLVRRGAIVPVPVLRRRPGGRRIRLTARQRYARRLPKGRKATRPGELVQIDTLFVNVRPDKPVKHFTAYDPVAKWTVGRVAGAASAASASALLDKLIAEAPFPIRGIQVDGGAEFMAGFEQSCRDKGLELFVLPPRRPDLNGCVERSQSTWRYEFYASYDLPHRLDKLQALVDAFAHRFNHYRPHDALGGMTPAEYLKTISSGDPNPSHMS
jgi:transposase InsO family protein